MAIKLLIKMFQKNICMRRVILFIVFIIVLLMCACAGEYKKRKSPNTHTIVFHYPSKGASKKVKRNKDQQIECRDTAPVGSHIKKTICATKAEWEKASQNGKDLANKVLNQSSRN